MKRYEAFLRRAGSSKPSFEEDARRQLTRQKVEGMVKSGIKVSDAELEHAYAHAGTACARPGPSSIRPPSPPRSPPPTRSWRSTARSISRRVSPARAPPHPVRGLQSQGLPPTVTPAEIDKYYEEHAREFETPHQARAAHILIRVPEGAEGRGRGQGQGGRGRGPAPGQGGRGLRQAGPRALAGSWLGRQRRGPGLRRQGRDGAPVRGRAVQAQEGRALPRTRADAVRLSRHQGHRRQGGGRKPKEAVAAEIRARLAAEASQRAAKAKADEVAGRAQAAPDFMAEAKSRGLTPLETTLSQPERAARPGARADSMQETAFNLTAPGGVSADPDPGGLGGHEERGDPARRPAAPRRHPRPCGRRRAPPEGRSAGSRARQADRQGRPRG